MPLRLLPINTSLCRYIEALKDWLKTLESNHDAKPEDHALITFDRWLSNQTFDVDDWSEDELLELYKEDVEAPTISVLITATARTDQIIEFQVQALNALAGLFAKTPMQDDSVSNWFSKRVGAY